MLKRIAFVGLAYDGETAMRCKILVCLGALGAALLCCGCGGAAPGFGKVEYLDVMVTHQPEQKTATVFVLNRDLENEQELELNWHDLTPTRVIGFETITGNDLKALNTFADPKKVVPQTVASPSVGSKMSVKLPARSYSVITLAV